MENFGNKEFICFKSHIILNSVMKPHAILPCLAQDVNIPLVQCTHSTLTTHQSLSSHLGHYINYCNTTMLVFK